VIPAGCATILGALLQVTRTLPIVFAAGDLVCRVGYYK